MSISLKKVTDFITFVTAVMYSVYRFFIREHIQRVVIYYHGIGKTDVTGFVKQMAYVARKCRVVKPSMIKDAHTDETRVLLAITFDDAFMSVLENALPVLKKFGLSAGVFVPTGCLGRSPNWAMAHDCPDKSDIVMSEQQIRELDNDGFEVLSHTVSHSSLTQLDDDQLREEFVESQRELQRIIGREIMGISYPHGEYDARVCIAAKRAGYKFGFTIEPRVVNCSTDSMSIGRFKVSPKDGMLKFGLKVNGSYQAVQCLRRLKALFARTSVTAEI